MTYLQDLLDLGQSSDFDEGVFQAYQTIGRSLCAQGLSLGGQGGDIARELGKKLDTFNASWQLCSGLCMNSLWTAFRPATAKNLSELEFSIHVGKLADRFDALKWSSGASFRELEVLQSSIVHLHTSIETTLSPNLGPLIVCYRSAGRIQMLMQY